MYIHTLFTLDTHLDVVVHYSHRSHRSHRSKRSHQSWIFKPRLTEADSRSYYDDGVLDAMFALDWDRATNSAKFQKVRSLYVRNVFINKNNCGSVKEFGPLQFL